MLAYIIRRLIHMIPVVIGVTIITFVVMRVIPGDVAALMLGENATPQDIQKLRESLGLNEPIHIQYLQWLGNAITGDLGTSFRNPNQTVTEAIIERLPVTMQLSSLAIGLGLLISIPTAVISALKQDTWIDQVARVTSVIGLAAPNFWVGTLIILFPAIWWHYGAPPTYQYFWQNPVVNLQQIVPAAVALGLTYSAGVARMGRSTMLEVLRQDYIRTAYAKGLQQGVVMRRHALKNAMIPVVTLIGLQFGRAVGGTAVIEQIFNIPGEGQLILSSINFRDYNVVQGVVLLLSLTVMLSNLFVDILYAWLDPRIRYS